MAALTSAQVSCPWSEGIADRAAIIAVKNVTAADTVDLGPGGVLPLFLVVKRAVGIGLTTAGSASLTVSGTVVTIPAGLANDAAFLLVYGCAT